MISKINERTLVPMSLVIILLGAAGWVAKFYFMSEANAEAIRVLSEQQVSYMKDVGDIKDRLVRIETKVDIIQKDNQ